MQTDMTTEQDPKQFLCEEEYLRGDLESQIIEEEPWVRNHEENIMGASGRHLEGNLGDIWRQLTDILEAGGN